MAAQRDLVEILARFDPKIVKMSRPASERKISRVPSWERVANVKVRN
jgi:hypothetical protein